MSHKIEMNVHRTFYNPIKSSSTSSKYLAWKLTPNINDETLTFKAIIKIVATTCYFKLFFKLFFSENDICHFM